MNRGFTQRWFPAHLRIYSDIGSLRETMTHEFLKLPLTLPKDPYVEERLFRPYPLQITCPGPEEPQRQAPSFWPDYIRRGGWTMRTLREIYSTICCDGGDDGDDEMDIEEDEDDDMDIDADEEDEDDEMDVEVDEEAEEEYPAPAYPVVVALPALVPLQQEKIRLRLMESRGHTTTSPMQYCMSLVEDIPMRFNYHLGGGYGITSCPNLRGRESSSAAAAARPAGGLRADYGFVATIDREIRRDPERCWIWDHEFVGWCLFETLQGELQLVLIQKVMSFRNTVHAQMNRRSLSYCQQNRSRRETISDLGDRFNFKDGHHHARGGCQLLQGSDGITGQGTKGVVEFNQWLKGWRLDVALCNDLGRSEEEDELTSTDVVKYNQRFQELALLCVRMFPEESSKIERLSVDLPEHDHGNHTIKQRQSCGNQAGNAGSSDGVSGLDGRGQPRQRSLRGFPIAYLSGHVTAKVVERQVSKEKATGGCIQQFKTFMKKAKIFIAYCVASKKGLGAVLLAREKGDFLGITPVQKFHCEKIIRTHLIWKLGSSSVRSKEFEGFNLYGNNCTVFMITTELTNPILDQRTKHEDNARMVRVT
ncbi:hypothetical protein Tco_0937192 [Tanacetum coccineum]|uniref:Uncharacterized protein n=1 Tax=Tanacetum coccineum TaxID=301880 RepID=A0ABQ5DEP5_9ASTR